MTRDSRSDPNYALTLVNPTEIPPVPFQGEGKAALGPTREYRIVLSQTIWNKMEIYVPREAKADLAA